jgi:DNA-binding beta-propeller fold protein YncE
MMPRDPRALVFIGIKNAVVALDERTGAEVWQTELRTNSFVYVIFDGQSVYATNAGEVWRIDPEKGTVIWRNELKGLGRGFASLASSRAPGAQPGLEMVAEMARQAAAAAEAASAAS